MTERIQIYFAGHTRDVEVWIKLQDLWANDFGREVDVCCSWLSVVKANGDDPTPAMARAVWTQDITEAVAADVVVVWASNTQKPLRGALVEVGAALGVKNRVICVGTNISFNSWTQHPLVSRVVSFEEALQLILLWHRFHAHY